MGKEGGEVEIHEFPFSSSLLPTRVYRLHPVKSAYCIDSQNVRVPFSHLFFPFFSFLISFTVDENSAWRFPIHITVYGWIEPGT